MTTTLNTHVRKIQWFCQQGERFCMHVFSSNKMNTTINEASCSILHVRATFNTFYIVQGDD